MKRGAKKSKLARMHERRQASVEKEIALLTRIIERDDILADVLAFLMSLKPVDADAGERRDELVRRMTKIIQ